MKDTKKELKFLVSTQQNHNLKLSKEAQYSEVRSHLASRQHAIRRAQNGLPLTAPHKRRSHESVGESSKASVQALPDDFVPHDASPSPKVMPAAPVASGNVRDEELSLRDLIDIFQSTVPLDENAIVNDDPPLLTADDFLSPKLGCEETQYNRRRFAQTQNYFGNAIFPTSHPPKWSISHFKRPPESFIRSDGVPQAHRLDKALTAPAITEISSILDPFIRLPTEIMEQEQSLIHFYLNFGRRWFWGTSEDPKHCPAIDIARSLLQVDPIYSIVGVVLGEAILSRVSHRAPRPLYYSRRAHLYKAINVLLSNKDAALQRKIFAFILIAFVEYSDQRPDLQALHISAMERFIKAKGGVAVLLSPHKNNSTVYLTARFYASQFFLAEVQIPTFHQLKGVQTRFINYIRRIQMWTVSLHWRPCSNEAISTDPIGPEARSTYRRKLKPIIDYLHNLVEKWLSDNDTSAALLNYSGAYFCAFSLAMTLVEYDHSPAAAFDFLHRAQECLRGSTTINSYLGRELENLHPIAATHSFSHTRCEMFSDGGHAREIRISEAVVDAQKIFLLLSKAMRTEIVVWLVECVLAISKPAGRGEKDDEDAVVFDQKRLKMLEQEIGDAWKAGRSGNREEKNSR